MKKIGLWIMAATLAATAQAQVSKHKKQIPAEVGAMALHYGWQAVDGIHLFFREGGPAEAPTLVLLHGSPTSSIMYQAVMERLAATKRLHVIAMDYPSFGYSDVPDHKKYGYTFDHVAETVAHFLAARNIQRYALYMQDYGVPIGFRLIQASPGSISAIIVQNGVIHLDGFPMAQDPNGKLRSYWRTRDRAADKQFAEEVAHLSFPGAANWTLGSNFTPDEQLLLNASEQRSGDVEARLDLWFDYGSNLAHYPEWQKLLKSLNVPVEVIWGSHDDFFTVPGAVAYLRDAPKAEIHILDAGHFATLEAPDPVADLVTDFARRYLSAL